MRLKYTFEIMQLDDDVIAVPVGNNSKEFQAAIRLNESGAEIFDLLNRDTTEEEIVKRLHEHHDIDLHECSEYVHEFIDGLKRENLLEM